MDHAHKLHSIWDELEKGNEEAIHEARKLTRKAQADLRAVGASRKTQKPWKKLRQTIAPIRDLDVTLSNLKKLLKDLHADAVTLELLGLHYQTLRLRMWSEVRLPARPKGVADADPEQVKETLQEDWAALKKEARKVLKSDDATAWHSWRKHLKRYRYTWEILAEAPTALVDLLGHLGNMQDMEVLKAELQGAPEFLHPYLPELQELLNQQHQEEQQRAVSVWQEWSNTHAVLIES
ncbi:CHAD domain-containing protein [Deinococcus roseus]|uniref:CHAD domain-containing protein n=1 Tax=Deinococcus roseus TaxID=392414 RepID=A0ABQ2CXV6_9DEIO|nr:CHAD domain-containing protein [Deinococcus roseus]GGJ20337.1 hypothetical protein GCM10008938_03210 [Deinococcus roseus]